MKFCPHARSRLQRALTPLGFGLAGLLLAVPAAYASSHREGPFIAGQPKLDATDLYMFRSYETAEANRGSCCSPTVQAGPST